MVIMGISMVLEIGSSVHNKEEQGKEERKDPPKEGKEAPETIAKVQPQQPENKIQVKKKRKELSISIPSVPSWFKSRLNHTLPLPTPPQHELHKPPCFTLGLGIPMRRLKLFHGFLPAGPRIQFRRLVDRVLRLTRARIMKQLWIFAHGHGPVGTAEFGAETAG